MNNEINANQVISYIEQQRSYLQLNKDIFNILEGNVFKFVDKDLRNQLSLQSYEQAKFRISSVNLFKRIVDKFRFLM